MKRTILAAVLVLQAAGLQAQLGFEHLTEKLLVPVPINEIDGAFGSRWKTTLVLTNMDSIPIELQGPQGTCNMLCPNPAPVPRLQPESTVNVEAMVSSQIIPAAFLRTAPGDAARLGSTLRVQDLSRSNETWGTTIPLLRADDLFAATFGMTGIATDPQFRAVLRLYDVDGSTPPQVAVRIYRVNENASITSVQPPDELLQEFTPVFTVPNDEHSRFWFPAYAQIPLWTDPALVGADRIRIEVEPLDARQEYWGFVSITHNETQHVTVVLP